MARPRPEQPTTLKIGWLEAFIAVAQCGSYVEAGEVLGVNRTAAQRSVAKLEFWMRRVLIMDDVQPHNLSPDGKILLPIAVRTIHALGDEQQSTYLGTPSLQLSLRRSARSRISLSVIGSLNAFKSEGPMSYKRAASALGIATNSVRADITAIEQALGYKVVSGFSRVCLTEKGALFLTDISQLSDILHSFRSALPSDYNSARIRAERNHGILLREARRLDNGLLRYRNVILTPDDQKSIEQIEEAAIALRYFVNSMEDDYGRFNTVDGRCLLIDK